MIIRNYNKLQQFKNKINCDLVFSIYPEIINKKKIGERENLIGIYLSVK